MHGKSNIDSHLKVLIDKVTQAAWVAVWMGVFSRGWMDMLIAGGMSYHSARRLCLHKHYKQSSSKLLPLGYPAAIRSSSIQWRRAGGDHQRPPPYTSPVIVDRASVSLRFVKGGEKTVDREDHEVHLCFSFSLHLSISRTTIDRERVQC
jgi:hypothetical protein